MRPKSRIFTAPAASTITFDGFTSRCSLPASCRNASPSAIPWNAARTLASS
ncbi:MAG: hypothetical protein QM820_32750 [Minicystis sp.]